MTKSIIITYDEADENFLMTFFKKLKVKTKVLETKPENDLDSTNNRKEILESVVELDNKVFQEVSQEELYQLTHK
jgi:hypothetical protein